MKKGFTLIELLAVIIVLGVVAVIATPIVLDVVEDAKNSARDSKLKLYADNIKLKATENYFDNNGSINGEIETTSLNNSSTSCDKAYYNDGKIYLSDCSVDGEDGFYYVNGDIETEEPSNWEDLIAGLSAPIVYKDNSGANAPELLDKMVAVKYDGTNWLVADTTTEWYDYDNKEWANAVVLNSGVSKAVDDTISESEVALWFVWIPRYKYTIFNGNNGGVPVQEINVTFESGTSRTGTVTCTDNIGTQSTSETCSTITNGTSTYTHPAFKLGTTELTGIWVGKFENSAASVESNTVQTVLIRPNVISWRSAQVATFYTSIKNITSNYGITNADSHMMKNMEWGAVAYLKQSKYGLGTTDIGINNNSSYTTGCGATAGSSSSSTCNAYNTTTGILASTTGNIYGVYDMSGGTWEYVMGNMVNSSSAFYPSSAGTISPESKYYDAYSYDSSSYTTHGRGKLGDATKETLVTYGNVSGGWYGNFTYFPCSSTPWFVRGGLCNSGPYAGVFDFSYAPGSASSAYAARSVLVSGN